MRKKTHEEFVAEVKALVGDEYKFFGKYSGNQTKMKVKHNACNFEYNVKPHNFLQGCRCPKCAGKVRKDTPYFLNEIKGLVGDEYTFFGEYANSKTKMKVKHTTCGFEYTVSPSNFINLGNRCPKCAGQIKTHAEFIEQVRNLSGEEYIFLEDYKSSNYKTKVKHIDCGHIYKVRPANFLTGTRCPNCSISKGESFIREFLKKLDMSFYTEYQVYIKNRKYPLRIDFYVQGIAIEYDGIQHYESIEHFGGETALQETQRRDAIKTQYCADNGIPLIRIPYWDYDNIDAILTEKLLPLLKDADKHNAS